MPKVDTFSIVVGTEACNAKCPFCVARMTSNQGVPKQPPPINWRNFQKACAYARIAGVNTVMLTGKGEPTLYPDQITEYLECLENQFPIIELQTNATRLSKSYLVDWYNLGLTTVSISISHYDAEENRKIYLPHKETYIDLTQTVAMLHEIGFSVRLACVMSKGLIDTWDKVMEMINFAFVCGAEQLTLRPVNRPNTDRDMEVVDWVDRHQLDPIEFQHIREMFEVEGQRLLRTGYGATIYDVKGQNVCLTNSLTLDQQPDEIRQIIFYPDGHLRYDWTYSGAIIF